MSKIRGSKKQDYSEITKIIKKTTRSTTCYDLLLGENSYTTKKLCCDSCEKLLDPTIASRKTKNTNDQCHQPWNDQYSNHHKLYWVKIYN